MIVDFTVENYRSIKEPVTLSAVAQKSRSGTGGKARRGVMPDDEIAPPFPVEGRGFALLPVLAIYGANASGKSNVLRALDDLLTFMASGAGDRRKNIRRFVPFRLNEATAEAPSRFQIRVVLQQTIFTYALQVNHTRVLWERLECTPPAPTRSRLLYERSWHESKSAYAWKNGAAFAGSHTQLEQNLEDHEPFISLLAKRLKVKVVESFTEWLMLRWDGSTLGHEGFEYRKSVVYGRFAPRINLNVANIIKRFDTGLTNIEIKKLEGSDSKDEEEYEAFVRHDTSFGCLWWPLEEESIGTQRLFALAYQLTHSFIVGTPFVVDELGTNVHPQITRAIVQMVQDPKTNPKRAQLIFTSHDNTLMRGNLLRRDQVWLTQKRPDGSTDLYPLTDFKVRNDLALDRAYLDGRYGAVPLLPPDGQLLSAAPEPAGRT